MVRRAQHGDRAAQRIVYDRYASTMFAISRRYATSQAEAEDFSQDAWVRIFRKLDTFNFKGSLEGWMRRVTVTTALRGIEKRGRPLAELTGAVPEEHHVDPVAIGNLSADELRVHIANLPEGYRLVFNLYAVEEYTHDEIAKVLGINASTSRSQLTKARRMLKRRLSTLLSVCL